MVLVSSEQDLEEHGGRVGEGDHTVPQQVRRQPGDTFLPLAALAKLPAVRPGSAPHPPQHDEQGVSAVSPPLLLLIYKKQKVKYVF